MGYDYDDYDGYDAYANEYGIEGRMKIEKMDFKILFKKSNPCDYCQVTENNEPESACKGCPYYKKESVKEIVIFS